MYIAQKLRLAKYLGNSKSFFRINELLSYRLVRMQCCVVGYRIDVPSGYNALWGFLRTSLPSGLVIALDRYCICHLLTLNIGMLESCVAPSLVLLISMFYKKDEQVRVWIYIYNSITSADVTSCIAGETDILVLCYGSLSSLLLILKLRILVERTNSGIRRLRCLRRVFLDRVYCTIPHYLSSAGRSCDSCWSSCALVVTRLACSC